MARIDIAMLRSRAYASTGTEMLTKRIDPNEIMDKANNVKTTLSSWDNCMAESYCKYVSPPPTIYLHCFILSAH